MADTKDKCAADLLDLWLSGKESRKVGKMCRIQGRWVIELRDGDLIVGYSRTQLTLESAIRTALMIAAYSAVAP